MKVAILGAAHQHVDYVLDELAHREELELVAASEPDPALRARFLGALQVELDAAGAPSELDARAEELGMVRPTTTYFIELATGEITGGPAEEGTN